MRSALSHNEIELLHLQAATLSQQLSEIADSLDSRLGETDELAKSARSAQQEFAKFSLRVRRRAVSADTVQPDSGARSA
jgi:uncharacterized coiled-coil DUF342 family protein